MRRFALATLALIASTGATWAAGDPATIAKSFYDVYATVHASDGIPNANERASLEPYLSPRLDRLLTDAEAAEARFVGHYKSAPPLVEGDLLTSNFEGATAFTIRKCESHGAGARCAIDLSYEPQDGHAKPVSWTDRLYFVQTPSGWRIDDIGYGAITAFGNKGRLSDTLKEVIQDAGA